MCALGVGIRMLTPPGVEVEAQSSWGAIGWGTADALGHCAAAPDRRVVLLAGEGGHQMTANDLGTFARYGLKPIIFVVNNNGYFAERVTNRNPDEEYNDLAQWDYVDLPIVLGCKGWFTAKVSTLSELDAAMEEASRGSRGGYIEVIVDTYSMPLGGEFLFAGTGPLFGMPGRTWAKWKAEFDGRQK